MSEGAARARASVPGGPGGGAPTRAAVERHIADRLRVAGVPSPEVDARWLVDHVVEVVGDPANEGRALLEGLVVRRIVREPLQLILGRTWFRTLELRCAPGVFIPRPETEIVAGAAIDAAEGAHATKGAQAAGCAHAVAAATAAREAEVRVIDVCTGTGAIACSVAAEVAGVSVVASDLSAAAVEVAELNAARLRAGAAGDAGLADGARLEVVQGDLLDAVDPEWAGTVDVLVANPPYLPIADRGSWQPEVAFHDPDLALVGGEDGHELVDRILGLAPRWLRRGGTVVVEIDDRRGADAMAAAEAVGLADVRLVQDLTGRDRAVVARRPG